MSATCWIQKPVYIVANSGNEQRLSVVIWRFLLFCIPCTLWCGGRGHTNIHIISVILFVVQLLNKMPLLLTHQMKQDLGQVIQVCCVMWHRYIVSCDTGMLCHVTQLHCVMWYRYVVSCDTGTLCHVIHVCFHACWCHMSGAYPGFERGGGGGGHANYHDHTHPFAVLSTWFHTLDKGKEISKVINLIWYGFVKKLVYKATYG